MKTFKITLLLCMLSAFGFAQTVHTVDNRDQSGAQFTGLQAAIDAANAGDIIQVHPSPTGYGSVTVDKQLTIMGVGHNPANYDEGEIANIYSIKFINNSAGSEVKGLFINEIETGDSNMSPDHDNIHIINNHINTTIEGSNTENLSDNWIIEGNYFTSGYTNVYANLNSDNWQVKNNFFRGYLSDLNNTCVVTNNIFLTSATPQNFFYYCDFPFVNNNIFLATDNLTEIGLYNSNITFVSNITYSYYGSTIAPLGGSNNLDNTDPQFVDVPTDNVTDFYNNNYDLAEGSPGINAGSDEADIGIYGNYDFDPDGRPNLTPYPENITINNSVVAPGQSLDVDFSATQKQ